MYQYQKELDYYAKLIQEKKAEALALIEIENCEVAEDVATNIGPNWRSVCIKSRDTFTGQDVSLLFDVRTFTPIPGSQTTHPGHYAMNGDKKVRPSKVLSVVAQHNGTNESYLFTVAHLISKTRPANDSKRQAQAIAVRLGMDSMKTTYDIDHTVLMGDMNDYPGSKTLINLKGDDLTNPADQNDCSYTYQGKCNLIDHILVSKSLSGGELTDLEIPEKYSDHKAMLYQFP